jgi:predicted nuclease of restriction endonuclease-like RecB superfamily
MTTNQEIKRLLRNRATSIVDERIIPETLDSIAEWTGELMGKLTTLDSEDREKADQAFNQIHEALIRETVAQLVDPLVTRRKRLFEEK